MPGAGTHTTVIQHLAQENPDFLALLGDPTVNASWAAYETVDALKSRYAVLGAMGPDIFYAMLDYGGDIQTFEDNLIKILGTFQCTSKLSAEINNYIDGTLNSITFGVWDAIQSTFSNLGGILKDGILDLVIDKHNFWSVFLPLRQVDDYRQNWYWADYLHYVKTGCFTKKLLDMCQTYSTDPTTTGFLKAYSLGYLTHYVADTVGHAYVNRIVESPWRNCWQRHHLVENFIDAYVWDHWHDGGTEPQQPSADEQGLDLILTDPSNKMTPAPLHFARLSDLCNIGHLGIDPTIDSAISTVCEQIQKGLFDIGVSSVPSLQSPDDPAFITWTNFMADAMWATYPPTEVHPLKLSSNVIPLPLPGDCRESGGGYPTPDDVAGAYGLYRLVLSLATEDKMKAPVFPDIIGDIGAILDQLWKDINQNLGNIPPPPPVPSTGGFSLDGLWNSIKSYAQWLGQVAVAVLKTVGDLILAAIQIGGDLVTEPIKVALWLLNSALFAQYHTLRMTLVMTSYSVPLTEDLTGNVGPLDLQTLWKTTGGEGPMYPIEPILSQRDLTSDPSHPHSPYRPYFKPSDVAPAPNVEMPATSPPAELLAWMTPDDMLEKPVGKDVMLSANGLAPPTTEPLVNPDGSLNTPLETFDGSQRYFGGIFANCEAALNVAVPYVSGTPLPEGTLLPDYNLDSDRGYAWPCWDVDYSFPTPGPGQGRPTDTPPFPWNGCDPFPAETTLKPPRPGLLPVDPWGKPRNGNAWVNAAALNAPGDCRSADVPFSWIHIDPSATDHINPTANLDALDPCDVTTNPNSPGGQLTFDYQIAPSAFLHSDASRSDFVLMDPKDPTNPAKQEHDGRLIDFLRNQAKLKDPLQILANAVTLSLIGTVTLDGGKTHIPPPASIPVDSLATAVAQLAVTGRESFSKFNQLQDAALVTAVTTLNKGATFDPAQLAGKAHDMLDEAYQALWAIRGNDPGWRAFRSTLGWIAVSGFDDTAHRPVNVPTAPYPQYDITFDVPIPNPDSQTHVQSVTTRYLVASARTFIGPNDAMKSSFTVPAGTAGLLQAPPSPVPFSSTPAPRTVPQDKPTIPSDDHIIIYIHGGGSRAEEAVGLANWLIVEGYQGRRNYTVISFDLPNSAYATPFQVSEVVGGTYDPFALQIRDFDKQYVVSFIEELDKQVGNVKGRIVAVMGGSLGGNMSLLLSRENDASHQYLNTIVSWSVTAVSPSTYLGILSNGLAGAYLGHLKDGVASSDSTGTPPDDHTMEAQYISKVYFDPLSPGYVGVVPYIPADPIMWYRGPDPITGAVDWPPPDPKTGARESCKSDYIAQSRYDRYEIYSERARRWTQAIDLEQICFSFQDNCLYRAIASAPGSHLLLAAGDRDNFNPPVIYNSTIDVARLIRHTAHGKAEFWSDTGHSLHAERPHLFAREIVYFLNNLGAGNSPNGDVTAPVPAPYSNTAQ